jgi:hypothetical protein
MYKIILITPSPQPLRPRPQSFPYNLFPVTPPTTTRPPLQSFSSMYDVLDTFGRPPPAPRISLSYEKPAPPSVGRAGKRRLL